MFHFNCFDKSLKLSDGVELVSRLWVPEIQKPCPALLMRQPYGRQIASTVTYPHPDWFASKGYLVVVQDVRGQGDSGGEFRGFIQEANDSEETHKWVRSLKECNGKLGLYGFSYQGLTQLISNENSIPPDCLSPAMTGFNIEKHWAADGGAFWWDINISWALQIAALKMKRANNSKAWEKIRSTLENKMYLRNGIEILQKYDPENFILNWNEDLRNNRHLEIFKLNPTWIKRPMLIIGGLWDQHLKGALDLYQEAKLVGGNPEIIIANATHLNWWEGYQNDLLNFFDRHLMNSNKKKYELNKKIWNISLCQWDDIDSNKNNIFKFGFQSNGIANISDSEGRLVTNSKGSGFVSIVHDPWRPVQSQGGHLGPNQGIFNRKILDKRKDIAKFQTNKFISNQHLLGIPLINVSIICDQPNFDICLALSFINEEETYVNQFSTGFLRISDSERNKKRNYKIEMQPVNLTLLKGYKLRLSLSGSSWPAIGVNPGNDSKIYGPPTINHKITTITLDLTKSFMNINPFFK